MCSLFKNFNFKDLTKNEPPLSQQEISNTNFTSEFAFEMIVEKRMTFGNFKPRLLTISSQDQNLIMAYRYHPSREIKRSLALDLNDYAQVKKDREF